MLPTRIEGVGADLETAEGGPFVHLLTVRLLGGRQVALGATPLLLPPRQVELLAVLALSPEGLSLDALPDRLHGDRPVSAGTTKAEVSHLRRVLGGRLSSRPYRLTGRVRADHVDVLDDVIAGRLSRAAESYRGPLLPDSEAPALVVHRHLVGATLRNATVANGSTDNLARLASRMPDDPHLHEVLVDRLASDDPRLPLALARLEALPG